MLKLLAADGIDSEVQAHYRLIGSVQDTVGMHTHDFFELFLILKGSVVHIVNGRRFVLPENTLVFMRPRDAHAYERTAEEDCAFINLSFCREVIDDLILFLGSGFPSGRLLQPELPPTLLLSRTEKQEVQYRLERLESIPQQQKARYKAEVRALLTDLFSRYIRTEEEGEEETEDRSGQPAWLEKLCREARNKECFTQGAAELVRLSGRSHAYVCRMFRKHLGMSPTCYINELRMDYAENLLLNTDMEIVDICLEVGLDNVSYFYDLFKRKHGLPPAIYRRSGAVRKSPLL